MNIYEISVIHSYNGWDKKKQQVSKMKRTLYFLMSGKTISEAKEKLKWNLSLSSGMKIGKANCIISNR